MKISFDLKMELILIVINKFSVIAFKIVKICKLDVINTRFAFKQNFAYFKIVYFSKINFTSMVLVA